MNDLALAPHPASVERSAPANRLIALVVGVLLLPIIALIAAVVRLSNGRPVLFVQERAGLDGQLFRLRKFRTMRSARFAGEEDAVRITRSGRFLRRSSLDELPSLWNVLMGDMALVGPRPLLPAYTSLYDARQRVRLDVHPGLTGWTQIKGRNRLTWEAKFELDCWYVEHRSVWFDSKILLLTPLALLKASDTTHDGHASMPVFRGNADPSPSSSRMRPPADQDRIYLSAPDVGLRERELLLDAFDSNWIAPFGPHIDLFEQEFARTVGMGYAVALSSGTAALHLALCLLDVGPGDTVLVPSLTFVATANAVGYTGAEPVFIDSELRTWNIDPILVAEELELRARSGCLPRALIAVDIYGQCADYPSLREICDAYHVPIIEDAAEALGAGIQGRPAGAFGSIAAFSFNGNKIITTSGGGMLVTDRADWAAMARHLATQAREPAPHYEHIDRGYNYRMSNLLAALGRGQLATLGAKVDRRRRTFEHYQAGLADLPGLTFMPEPAGFRSTRWLTVGLIDPQVSGTHRGRILELLAGEKIEARPAWKPMHLQPLHRRSPMRGGAVAARIFEQGICLPSGSGLTETQVDCVISVVHKAWDER